MTPRTAGQWSSPRNGHSPRKYGVVAPLEPGGTRAHAARGEHGDLVGRGVGVGGRLEGDDLVERGEPPGPGRNVVDGLTEHGRHVDHTSAVDEVGREAATVAPTRPPHDRPTRSTGPRPSSSMTVATSAAMAAVE